MTSSASFHVSLRTATATTRMIPGHHQLVCVCVVNKRGRCVCVLQSRPVCVCVCACVCVCMHECAMASGEHISATLYSHVSTRGHTGAHSLSESTHTHITQTLHHDPREFSCTKCDFCILHRHTHTHTHTHMKLRHAPRVRRFDGATPSAVADQSVHVFLPKSPCIPVLQVQ